MTKIRVISDTHNEFSRLDLNPAGEDVLVLAGDINVGMAAHLDANQYSMRLGVPVVQIMGNHESYTLNIDKMTTEMRDLASRTGENVTFLENDSVMIAGVRFIGATLWTDYNLQGKPEISRGLARSMLNDHRLIRIGSRNRRFDPLDAALRHVSSVKFIRDTAATLFDGPTVIVTHHAPSANSIHQRYFGDDLNGAYCSHLDDLVESSGAVLWIHGHTHTSFDYKIGDTRVVCNPRGYVGWGEPNENLEFNPDLIVEI